MKSSVHFLHRFAACLGPLAFFAWGTVSAHELQENRATLVQRENTLVTMTLYVDLPQALYQSLAPQVSFVEFAAAHANLPPDVFKSVLLRAQSRLQTEIRATRPSGQALTFQRWAWPEPTQVQAALRERLMEAMVAPGEHSHVPPLEVRAELHAAQPMPALRMEFPPVFGRVLVMSYRPKQVWAEPQKGSPEISF